MELPTSYAPQPHAARWDPQGEWRLRDLREALRDNQVHAAGLARELHAAGDRLKTVRAERRAMEARYGRRALLMLARPGA